MPIPASPRRIAWELRYRNHGAANFQLFCINGHGVGDEKQIEQWMKFDDDYHCPYCGTGKPWLFRWEVD